MAKKKRQKSKAAQATQAIRDQRETGRSAPPQEGLPPAEEPRSGGMMMNMRSGFKAAVGQGAAKKKKSWVDTALWILVAAAAVFFLWRRFG